MRTPHLAGRAIINTYAVIFLAYLMAPLLIMGGAALNDSRFPSIYPWRGWTGRWFSELWADSQMWHAIGNTILVGLAVVIVSLPIGTAAGLLLNAVQGRSKSFLYGVMVAPILTPGAVTGISTILFWNSIGVPAGLHLAVLGQCSFISAYTMLLVSARLQSFDPGLEEAALDLGASHAQVLRRIVIPHLYPALAAGAVIAFFQSVENFNTTLFTAGNSQTLTVYVFSQVRAGITPKINALALLLVLLTLAGALLYEVTRRRADRRERAAAREAERQEDIPGLMPAGILGEMKPA